MSALALWQAQHARVQDATAAPWLRELRADAWRRFEAQGLPGRRDEDWKYTRLSALERAELQAAPLPQAVPDGLPQGARLVFAGGRLVPAWSRFAEAAGVTVRSLADALAADGEALRARLRSDAAPARVFAWLNDALFEDGLWLTLAPGARLEEPLHVVHLGGVGNASAHLRLLVELGAQAQAQVVEHYIGLGAQPYHVNVLAQAVLAPGAHLRHTLLLAQGPAGIHIGDFRVRVGRDARFESHALAAGGGLLRQDLDVDLHEPGGECNLRGLTTAGGGEHVDFHTRIEHRAPHCRSEETYKGLVGGNGRGVFNGRVHVHPGAVKTDSTMTCANLLLSDRAEVDAKPELEIYADDVKCSHGATVGQLDEAQLFYLRARGIDLAAARALLMTAFARDALAGLDGDLADTLTARIDARLPLL
ncbi:Fe-S cluster assembly protein SufD [Immundisolibacter sp.]|uniref:Fe-S cluster assembly protein SufD n=1 Tax=Immundisolibacter sp. TaxID=1934948 RepID=UPI0026270B12|nr:Fe-S cluster assembly protein SufD [Immundisolibacter sp.]MDD3652021.1 Fe-S cluster assembly protein SufD [Immundisolibacter sp.]